MTTVKESMDEARKWLGLDTERLDQLGASLGSSDATITLTHSVNGLGLGATVEVRTDSESEVMYVWSADTAATTLSVRRAHQGTAITATSGTLVAVNPRVSDVDLYDAVVAVVKALPSEGLYRHQSTTITWDTVDNSYDISGISDLHSPYMVEVDIGSETYSVYDWRRDHDELTLTTLDPTGYTSTLHYRASFPAVTAYSEDLETDLGLPAHSQDVVSLGVAVRLSTRYEGFRNAPYAQQHARNPDDVPPTAGLRVKAGLEAEYKRRLAAAIRQQRQQWPPRQRMR